MLTPLTKLTCPLPTLFSNDASPVLEPMTKPWGQRTCYISDPKGDEIEIRSWNKPFRSWLEKDRRGASQLYQKPTRHSEHTMPTTLDFEWDKEKNRINIRKYGISFDATSYVFRDEFYIEMYDFEHSLKEDRYIAIGMVVDVLFVVFTERRDKIRLIDFCARRDREGKEALL